MSEPGSDIDPVNDVSLASRSAPDTVTPHPCLTEDQFQRWLETQRPPVQHHVPNVSEIQRPTHAMSESGLDNEYDSLCDLGGHEATVGTAQMPARDGLVGSVNPVGDIMALIEPEVSNQPDGDDQRLVELGLTWASCYAQDESTGPGISKGLADLVAKFVRNKPVEESVRKMMVEISVPENCPRLVVPQLNTGVSLALRAPNSKLTERVLSKITGIVCKAMVPVLHVLDDVMSNSDCKLLPGRTEALSKALVLMSTVINVSNQGRKNNIQNSIEEPLLRQICGPDTDVGDIDLFDFNVLEKVAELRKARNLGLANRSRGSGPVRGRQRHPSRPYYQPRHRGYPSYPRRGGNQSGQYYAPRGGRGSQSFLPASQRGKGRAQ